VKPDELPEDINNPKPQESAEVTPPIPSSLSDAPRISDNAEELFIPQDAATPEQVPIIESEIATRLESASLPPTAPETRRVEPEENPPSITKPATDIFVTSNKPLQQRISLAGKMPTPQELLEKSNRSQISKQEEESQESRENLPKEDAPMRIFITGASGCIGHYIVETLIEKTDYELFLLVRNPNKLKFDCNSRPGIHIVQGDMREIKRFGKLLKTINCAVLAAAGWGGQEAIDVNVFKTIELLNLLDPKVCQHVIYFSTASVLNRQNQLLKEAGQAGTDYIRSKYDFLRQVNRVPIAKRITTVFPTLVLGGDEKHPYSHVSGGLPDLMKETVILRFLDKPLLKVKPIDLIRFFQAEGSFHFIHARDIAQVVRYLIDHPPESQDSRWLVLGNEPVTINEVIEEACAYLNKPITRRFNLSPWLADIFIRLFRIQMSAWDRFSFEYRHFTYQNPVNPSTFGMPVYCPDLIDVLKLSDILPKE
jgi:nucleoside-diphosphate-sugar epimerase